MHGLLFLFFILFRFAFVLLFVECDDKANTRAAALISSIDFVGLLSFSDFCSSSAIGTEVQSIMLVVVVDIGSKLPLSDIVPFSFRTNDDVEISIELADACTLTAAASVASLISSLDSVGIICDFIPLSDVIVANSCTNKVFELVNNDSDFQLYFWKRERLYEEKHKNGT